MPATDIQKHMMRTFITLRISVGVIGLLFPFILGFGGQFEHVPFAGSMSAYYHANSGCWIPDESSGHLAPTSPNYVDPCAARGTGPMRNWFVAILSFIGAAMFAIKGFSHFEDWALNIAAVMAPMVAFNPMPWPTSAGGLQVHYFCAVTFFLCIGFTCVFCSDKTLKEMPPSANRNAIIARYKAAYWVLALVMVFAPLSTYFLTYKQSHSTFWLEAAGIFAFGLYWLVKTTELHRSNVEHRIANGLLAMDVSKLR